MMMALPIPLSPCPAMGAMRRLPNDEGAPLDNGWLGSREGSVTDAPQRLILTRRDLA
ncbi:hypothetical protein SAMN05443635_101435 [Roseobacter denitrificans OCh 114]|nr:hypothetical protein SAMN05443635_101435 [Roseobacter denitrificans OCh 114]